jgi:hypothetical protein
MAQVGRRAEAALHGPRPAAAKHRVEFVRFEVNAAATADARRHAVQQR